MNCRLQVAQKALHLRPLTIPDAGEEIDDPLDLHALAFRDRDGESDHIRRPHDDSSSELPSIDNNGLPVD